MPPRRPAPRPREFLSPRPPAWLCRVAWRPCRFEAALKRRDPGYVAVHFQPIKFVYAVMLAELGLLDLAFKYPFCPACNLLPVP